MLVYDHNLDNFGPLLFVHHGSYGIMFALGVMFVSFKCVYDKYLPVLFQYLRRSGGKLLLLRPGKKLLLLSLDRLFGQTFTLTGQEHIPGPHGNIIQVLFPVYFTRYFVHGPARFYPFGCFLLLLFSSFDIRRIES